MVCLYSFFSSFRDAPSELGFTRVRHYCCPSRLQPTWMRRPGIHNPKSWLWIPGSLASLPPRNDRSGLPPRGGDDFLQAGDMAGEGGPPPRPPRPPGLRVFFDQNPFLRHITRPPKRIHLVAA